MSRARSLTLALLVSAVVMSRGAASAASRFDPALRFRVVQTTHFRIHFHQHAERLATRLTVIAEETWTKLQQPMGVRPPAMTNVVIADQTEIANAFATPLPYDTVVIYPTVPPGSEFDADDWLRLVFTHEFTHIVHLDRSESWARVVRKIFGRLPVAFPNLYLPQWQIEGLAVYQESTLTGEGRLHAGDFRAVVEEAARDHALEPLDRVNGGLTDWPGGNGGYTYGARFHEYLAERFGKASLATLAERTARRVPYTAPWVFEDVFGEPLDALWRDFEASLTNTLGTPSIDAGAVQLTHDGFVVNAPRFDRHACAGCAPDLFYAASSPNRFPTLNRIASAGGSVRHVAERYLGSTTAIDARTIYFDQLEVQRNVALNSDLYELSRSSGHIRRLTNGARLRDPDLSPDGQTIAAVQERTGARDLVLVSNLAGEPRIDVVLTGPDTQFDAPRWSPVGRPIAVERHRLGIEPEVVLVDVDSRSVRTSLHASHTRIVMPSWRPDGRAILAAVAPDDQPFNIVEFDLANGHARTLTHTTGGATWPELSPDGTTLVYVGYTPAGYDLFSLRYSPDVAGKPSSIILTPPREPFASVIPAAAANTVAYSPLATIAPTSWSPLITWDSQQVRAGAITSGVDVLGYHSYSASATWLVSGPSSNVVPSRATPDWSIVYVYDRWRPTLFAAVSTQTSFFAGPATEAGTPSTATDRQHQIEAGVSLPFLRVRSAHAALATIFHGTDDYALPNRTLSLDRSSVRTAWQTVTARTFGYSISPERGIAIGAALEFIRTALGATADATVATIDGRAYLPGVRSHDVVASRLAYGESSGNPLTGRTFLLGGPGSNSALTNFGSSAMSLLRGFPANSFAGNHVALLNLEYRAPLERPQRGLRAWPAMLHTVYGAAFVDAGETWTRGFDVHDLKTSFGAELSATVVAGFYLPISASVGVARNHDGAGPLPDSTSVYFRIGKSF